MSLLATNENYAVGAAAESEYQPLGSLALTPGSRTIHVVLAGEINAKRGQLQVVVQGKNGLEVSSAQIRGFRATPGAFGGVQATVFPHDFDIPPSGNSESQQFVASAEIDLEVTAAGEIELAIAAPNPQGEAQASDVSLVRIAALSVD